MSCAGNGELTDVEIVVVPEMAESTCSMAAVTLGFVIGAATTERIHCPASISSEKGSKNFAEAAIHTQ